MARVILVLRPDRGGAFNHVVQLADALTDREHEVFLLGPHDSARHKVNAEVVPLEIGRRIDPRSDGRAIAAFARLVRELSPDLVHAHGSKGGVIARLAKLARPRTPVVFTPHLYAFDNYFARPAQRLAYRLIEGALAPLATRVIGVCESERRLAARIGPASRTRTVHNGVDAVALGEIHPAVAALREQGPTAVCVAELRESKGVVTLIEAMALVHASLPDARLAVAGDGDQLEAVRARIAENRLEGVVSLLGVTQAADPVLAGADLFVNPAYAEAFPYTVIEAMSAGLPIVATDVGGTREAVEDAGAGILVPPAEPEPLAAALVELLGDPRRRRELGRAARAAHRERFTTQAMIEGTLRVYAEIVPAFART